MFSLLNLPDSSFSLPGVRLSSIEAPTHVAKFDLTLAMQPATDGLYGSLSYNTDLIDAATVARMVEHLGTLLEAIASNPSQRLTELPLMCEDERRQVLVTWNRTSAPFADGACIHELFEAQVARTPDA
ncbi:condensation domain-containing protein, partial [Pyxidicoccus sp. 3LG]